MQTEITLFWVRIEGFFVTWDLIFYSLDGIEAYYFFIRIFFINKCEKILSWYKFNEIYFVFNH